MSAPVSGAPGDSGTAGAPAPATSPPDPTPPATGPTTANETGIGQGPAGPTPDVEALRAEVADWQAKAEGAQQSIVDKIAAALGLGGTGEAPTVEQVTEQLGTAQREARERAVDLAVYRAAPSASANPDALLDSTAFRRRVADLDPTAEGFADKVATAMADALKANPRLAASPVTVPRSGGEITGGSPTGPDDLGSLPVEEYINRTRKRRS